MKYLLRKQFHYYVQGLSTDDDELLQQLIEQGNRQKLIESKIKHTINLACFIARKYRRNEEDVVEMALVRLIECIDNYLLSNDRKPFKPYFKKYMYYAIKRDVVSDKLLGCSERTQQRQSKRLMLDSLNKSVETSGLLNDGFVHRETTISMTVKTEPVRSDRTYDLIESIRALLTDDEYRILELVVQGYTDKEVSALIEKSLTFVQNNRTRIQHIIKMALIRD